MSITDNGGARESARARVDALRSTAESELLADAAMALLGCRSADDVYEVIADFVLLLAPGAVVVVNETSPSLEWLITRKVKGMNDSLLMKAAELVGFEIVGKRSAVAPGHRDELLGGALSTIPGGFAELAAVAISRPRARAGAKAFRLHDAFSIGIADGTNVLGNIQIYTRAPDIVLPTHIIESFARHCYSALASIVRARELAESAENNGLLLRNMTEGLALHEIVLDPSGTPCDYRYVDVNPAYEAATGLNAEDIIGRTLLEVLPGVESSWLERYRAVVTTGVATRFEEYSATSTGTSRSRPTPLSRGSWPLWASTSLSASGRTTRGSRTRHASILRFAQPAWACGTSTSSRAHASSMNRSAFFWASITQRSPGPRRSSSGRCTRTTWRRSMLH